jgi:hypothetical protein
VTRSGSKVIPRAAEECSSCSQHCTKLKGKIRHAGPVRSDALNILDIVTSWRLEDEELKEMYANHPTVLVMGEGETAVNTAAAAKTAPSAGLKVKVYAQPGQLGTCS